MTGGFAVRRRGPIQFLVIPAFEATGLVVHAFTTRMGGFSSAPYRSLNMALHVGDDRRSVCFNRALVCRALDIDLTHLVTCRQVHGDVVRVVQEEDRGSGALEEAGLPEADALVTGCSGVPLASFYADCVPLFILDPVRRVVALAHAGWKGTVLRIGGKVVEVMAERFGSRPGDCLAGIGPAIGPCCYEVDELVVELLRESFAGWNKLVHPTGRGKWKLDLWEANRMTLIGAGLKPENITLAGLCTACRTDLFFSYRAEGGRTGRMASLLMLK